MTNFIRNGFISARIRRLEKFLPLCCFASLFCCFGELFNRESSPNRFDSHPREQKNRTIFSRFFANRANTMADCTGRLLGGRAGGRRVALMQWHSDARWRFSPPDLDNSGGFERCLAGKKYFWQVPNFWRISDRFDRFCTGFFCLAALAEFWRFFSIF
jgi:hypothetical protein